MTIGQCLHLATARFETAGITTPRLDAQVLLCRVLNQNKAWLLAHSDDSITSDKLAQLGGYIARRAGREPLAYILGRQEFYGRNFSVTPDVLIPRPETETLIEQLSSIPLPTEPTIIDVGTGSGAIAITAALELPHARVEACDISKPALAVAEQNAQRLGAQVYFFISDLLEQARTYDIIIANLPYVAPDWRRSPETEFEPALALFAQDAGLGLIKKLITQAKRHLNKGGFLLLEADPRQFPDIKKAAQPAFVTMGVNDFTMTLQSRI